MYRLHVFSILALSVICTNVVAKAEPKLAKDEYGYEYDQKNDEASVREKEKTKHKKIGKIKSTLIEFGFGKYFSKKTLTRHFQKKAAKNLKKVEVNSDYAFTEIKFDELSSRRILQGVGKLSFQEIEDGKIVLGVIPDEAMLKEAGEDISILSVVEMFELESTIESSKEGKNGVITTKFSPFDTTKDGRIWKHIDSPDYRPVKRELIDQGADFIHDQISQGNSVYVHCKSGKGRSAVMVAAYLIKYRNFTARQSIALIKAQRAQVSIGNYFGRHRSVIYKYEKHIDQLSPQSKKKFRFEISPALFFTYRGGLPPLSYYEE